GDLRPARRAAHNRALQTPLDRTPQRPAHSVPRHPGQKGRRHRPRRGLERGEGADQALRPLLQPHRGRGVRYLPRRPPRPVGDLRRRRPLRYRSDRAHRRVPRPLPRPRRLALAPGRRGARRPPHRGARRAGAQRGHEGARHRHQPEHHGRGDGPVHRGRGEGPAGAGNGPRQRPPRRRGPRVRRRGNARPRLRRPPRAI
ncbi:MAG: RecR, partial [uncultured Rubrobacteraceae bacterium]